MNKELPIKNPTPETKLALQAAIEAGKEVMNVYNQEFSSTLKSDKEPITEADTKSNDVIQKILSSLAYPILSEESVDDKKRLDSKKIWIIDPLDGTTDFVNRTGEFTIMIALVENNKPILGIIYWPTEEKLFLAQKGQGAFQQNQGSWTKISVSDISKLEKCRAVGSRHHISEKEHNLLTLLKVSKFTSKGSSLKVADISCGLAELYFTTTNKMKQWDTCASYCLISEAGGKMTDMKGNELKYNTENLNHENGLLVTNGLIHDEIIKNFEKQLSEN